jgi:hypothetical protein
MALALVKNRRFGKQLLEPRLGLCWAIEGLTELSPGCGADLEIPRIGNFLLGSNAGALKDEVRDVHTASLGAETNEPGFALA